MKDLMKSNIYESSENIVIVGSCLKNMFPNAYCELERRKYPIFDLCLEQTHINMAITKVLGMIRAKNIRKIIFASVDRSPHCIGLHYIQDEIRKLGFNIEIYNYVASEEGLIEIPKEAISMSKNLSQLSKLIKN